ncbi:uncharacterized protein LOC135946839 [Cloeon dipterum]|uniref:uncharacterized protein LOC135946839 n=1 Tax=Cloeon dipterum TaxID=197152 RepID=UPI00321F66EB
MLSNMVIFGFLLCCPFFLMFIEHGQAVVVTDADPSEYPYVFGVVRTPVKNGTVLGSQFTYFKVCNKFRGAKYPLRESDFNNLTTAVPDAQLIFFDKTSSVLKKVTAPVMNKTACAAATNPDAAKIAGLCVDSSGLTDLCPVLFYDTEELAFTWIPMVAIGSQLQGIYLSDSGCKTALWEFFDIAPFRQNLTSEIPEVEIF